jgi:hypothetical protein
VSAGGAIALAARIVLALVLVVAAVSKLRARRTSCAVTSAVLGDRWGPVVTAALPWVEFGVAFMLVAWWGPIPGIVAAILVLGFTAVLVRANARHVPCACFGGAADAPPGGGAILRNGALLALAIVATGTP